MLAVASTDAERALALLREDWRTHASEAERAAAECVIDHDAAEVTCPACGYTFPSGAAECPDCGLSVM